MKTKFLTLLLALGAGLATARAQSDAPVLTVSITEIGVNTGHIGGIHFDSYGSNYSASPITISFDGGGYITPATATINETNGAADPSTLSFTPGTGYTGYPTVTFSGGQSSTSTTAPTQAVGEAILDFNTFNTPNQNEAYGAAGTLISISALAVGADPAAGYTYNFFANGLAIGHSDPEPLGTAATGFYTPPVPGVYSFYVTTTDSGGNTAQSTPIRYFSVGTRIVAPEAGGAVTLGSPGSLVPIGSSVVIQAVSTPPDGFVRRLDFYTDWNNGSSSGTLIGSATTYPYNIIYTPTGANGTSHLIKVIAYDNNGAVVPETLNEDEIILTMTTANSTSLPTSQIVSPGNNALVEIPGAGQSIPVVVAAAPAPNSGAHITRVELYVNGVLYQTLTAVPYQFTWSPTVTGLFALTALAYDSLGNVVASTTSTGSTQTPAPSDVTVEAPPAVAIINPNGNAVLTAGVITPITAVAISTNLDASDNAVAIQSVQFYQDGNYVGEATSPSAGTPDDYGITFKPTQNISNGEALGSTLYAVATDALGFSSKSPSITVSVNAAAAGTTGTTTGTVVIGTPPTISLTTPATGSSIVVNTPTTFRASATAPNGNVSQVDFLVNGAVVSSATSYPYQASYTFTNLGNYTVTADVIDNVGDKTVSTKANITVVAEPAPVVSITTPSTGSVVPTGTAVTITANATSPNGTIAQVQFYENGILIGSATQPPYTVTFTPQSAGVYAITAIGTDNAGEETTSSTTYIDAQPATTGLGTVEYFGQYQGTTVGASGRFSLVVVDGKYATYIAHATTGTAGDTYILDLPVSAAGSFSSTNLTGNATGAGVSGTLPGGALFIGAATSGNGGYYLGSLTGQPNSQVTAIKGGDGELMVYITNGSTKDVADGTVDSTGAFNITTQGGNTLTGTIDPTSGFLTATLSGPAGGAILGSSASGGTFSDGVLRNISTRGNVGTGANVMVAGFYVGGTASKHLLIRAIGPTLASFGLSGSLSAPQLQVFSGTSLFASNTGWSSTPTNGTAVATADAAVGAFALPSGSADSALVGTFAPGAYTAQISGVGGATGVALAEIYDLDAYTPFTAQRLTNVSTRGQVGTGQSVLIAGFAIDGTAPKRLLIRGAGPSLASMGVTGSLTAAHIQLVSSNSTVLRENYNWEDGNDPALLTSAETNSGAYLFTSGSSDAAMLVVVPPGTYTVVLSGAAGATGVGLIEVYEVPQ